LAAVTGGEIASTFDHPELVSLGECDLIDEIMVTFIYFTLFYFILLYFTLFYFI
jgi:hypothetical protein